MRTDMFGDSDQEAARKRQEQIDQPIEGARIGGYEGLALRVIDGLSGRKVSRVIVNFPNTGSIPSLAADDIVEAPAEVSEAGLIPLPVPELPPSAKAMVEQVKEYERATVEAAMTSDAGLAAVALALHPLVPGSTVARELLADYQAEHGASLAYLR